MKIVKDKLAAIAERFAQAKTNLNNYAIGGGLDHCKFASRRHEDARDDSGKMTLGDATQLFRRATALGIERVKKVIEHVVPVMEWHHAGKLPKAYGGGMKKTYFLNANEIFDLATNWDSHVLHLDAFDLGLSQALENELQRSEKRLAFLREHASRIERIEEPPLFFHKTKQEMLGKHGWFDSSNKSYRLPEFFSGWVFPSEEIQKEFLNIN